MTGVIDIVWLREDLRVADNRLLHFDARPDQLLCVYVLDERWLAPLFEGESHARIGPARLNFLWQSLIALRGELLQLGSDLLVRVGDPAEVVLELATRHRARAVRVADHGGADERAQTERVRHELPPDTELIELENGYLFDGDQLPFACEELPGSFSAFRRQVEAVAEVEQSHKAAVSLPRWPDAPRGFPPLASICPLSAQWQPDERQAALCEGGEVAGRERLYDYLWRHMGGHSYKKTRDGLLGERFSTRLSAWLAQGCLSARQVFDQVRAWEKDYGATESSYWIKFELMWRDYFWRVAQHERTRMYGARELPPVNEAFKRWRDGRTGVPFIDAAMRELALTGWMPNRARQNVASFLVKDLGVDWRLGAAWFEHCLIDYDVASNWGNWRYIAGVGRDPRPDRYFNVLKQGCHYDPKGLYVAHWIPALKTLSPGVGRHQPWRIDPARFAAPVVNPSAWERWLVDPESATATHDEMEEAEE